MTHPLQPYIDHGFSAGKHTADSEDYCVLEGCALARGLPITDDPMTTLGVDLRPLNDSPHWRDDRHRAEHLGRVAIALWLYRDWSDQRRARFAQLLAEKTIRQILPIALRAAADAHLSIEHQTALRAAADRCASEGTAAKVAAKVAARAAAADAARAAAADVDYAADADVDYAADAAADAADAARAADAAARAASAAACAAPSCAATSTLELACAIYVACAEQSGATE